MEIKANQQSLQKSGISNRQDFSHLQKMSPSITKKLLVGNDSVSISGKVNDTQMTYSQNVSIDKLADKSYDQLQNYVKGLLEKQGISSKITIDDKEIDIATISTEDAQKLVADDGYYGVTQTSDRIVKFAIAVAEHDPSRIDAIKEGVDKGFKEALDAFGGSLPDISYQTYDAVMEKLDAWVAELNGSLGDQNGGEIS